MGTAADTRYSILLQRKWNLCKSMTEVLLISWSGACHIATKLKLRDTILKRKSYCKSSRGRNPTLQFTTLQLISSPLFCLPPLLYFCRFLTSLCVKRPYYNWCGRILDCNLVANSLLVTIWVHGQQLLQVRNSHVFYRYRHKLFYLIKDKIAREQFPINALSLMISYQMDYLFHCRKHFENQH